MSYFPATPFGRQVLALNPGGTGIIGSDGSGEAAILTELEVATFIANGTPPATDGEQTPVAALSTINGIVTDKS